MRRAIQWLGWWIFGAVAWVLMTVKLAPEELIAGAAVSALAATLATALDPIGAIRLVADRGWLQVLRALPRAMLRDFGLLGEALLLRARGREVRGRVLSIPFDAGGDDASSRARRAQVTALLSLTPNTAVLSIDRERGVIVVHQLIAAPPPVAEGETRWPC